jgi:hypothetical protein
MRKLFWPVCLAVVFAGVQTVSADVWDLDTANDEDDGAGTDNELTHGLVQVHDLAAEAGVVDQDWYYMASRPYASYEVLVDGLTGDVFSSTLPVDRLASDGTTVLDSGAALPGGLLAARSLRWQVAGTAATNYVRVTGANTSCTTVCTTSDQYTIKFFETTGYISRFNNAGTQTTVLLLQNAASYTITGTAYYFNTAGTLQGSSNFTLGTRGLSVISTASVVPGVSGSVVVTHDGRFGDLQGKSVALEPSTGFSFDTPMVFKAH